MTHKEIKISALWKLYHWAFHMYEGYPESLSDTLYEDVQIGKYTEKEAKKVQKELYLEGERILKRIAKLKT